MKKIKDQFLSNVGIGILIVLPMYLSIILILKAIGSLRELLQPITVFLPTWLRHEALFAVFVLLLICFTVGTLTKSSACKRFVDIIEQAVLSRIPGYTMFKTIGNRIVGDKADKSWQPALVETDDNALMPVFIIEEFDDDFYTVFVPSVPTPLAGSVFVYQRDRVHPVDIPFAQAIKIVSRWGEGAKELVSAMHKADNNSSESNS